MIEALAEAEEVSGCLGMTLGLRKCGVAHMTEGGEVRLPSRKVIPSSQRSGRNRHTSRREDVLKKNLWRGGGVGEGKLRQIPLSKYVCRH